MRIGSLFSGIGGLEMGLERAGVGHVAWQVERDPFCRSILAKHWPDAERFDDVCSVGSHNLAPVDVICGGFPCQDISYAGKGAGLAGERSGLWREYARIVREIRPSFVVVENVAALLARGLGDVLGDLASLGFDAEWFCLRASDVGAPHRRERVFVVAYRDDGRLQVERVCDGQRPTCGDDVDRCRAHVANAIGDRLQWPEHRAREERTDGASVEALAPHGGAGSIRRRSNLRPQPTGHVEPYMGGIFDGFPDRLDRWPARPNEKQRAWEAPRTVAEAENRAARLKALGNAVVPQCAEVVGRVLMQIVGAA
jgi:DNA (cytosine-5)-methyltransferase 1